MAFDLASARPEKGGFDLGSAVPVQDEPPTPSRLMSQVPDKATLTKTWSPVVNGQKVMAEFDPEHKAYFTTSRDIDGNPRRSMVVRKPDGNLALRPWNPPEQSPVRKAITETGKAINRGVGLFNQGVYGIPATIVTGWQRLYNALASEGNQIPEESMASNKLDEVTGGAPRGVGENALAMGSSMLGGAALAKGIALPLEYAAQRATMAAAQKAAVEGAQVVATKAPMTMGRHIATTFASNPAMQFVSGGTAGASSEAARQQGASPIAQTAAGLVGAMVPGVAPAMAERIASSLAGRLTAGGREAAHAQELLKALNNPDADKEIAKQVAVRLAAGGEQAQQAQALLNHFKAASPAELKASAIQSTIASGGEKGMQVQMLLNDMGMQIPSRVRDAIHQLRNLPENTVGAPTTAQVLQDRGLLGMEKGLRKNPAVADQFAERDAENAAARAQALEQIAPAQGGTEKAVEYVRGVVSKVQGEIDAAEQSAIAKEEANVSGLQSAQDKALSAAAEDAAVARRQTGDEVKTEDVGQSLMAMRAANREAARKEAVKGFGADKYNDIRTLPAPQEEIKAIIDKYYSGVAANVHPKVRKAIQYINNAVIENSKSALPDAAKSAEAQVKELKKAIPKSGPTRGPIDPTRDDLLVAIVKNGGLSKEAAVQAGIDPAAYGQRPMFGGTIVRKNGGLSLDQMAARLHQDQYPVALPGDAQHDVGLFTDSLHGALRGERVMAPVGHETDAMREHMIRSAEEAGKDSGAVYGPVFDNELRPVKSLTPRTMSYSQMESTASLVGALERSAANAGESKVAMQLGDIKKALYGSMDKAVEAGSVPPEMADEYFSANQKYAQMKTDFDKGAAAGMMESPKEGTTKVLTKDIPGKMLLGGSEALKGEAGSFKSAIEAAPNSRETAENWLATQWRSKVENGGEPLKGWQRTHNTWMAKPEVQAAMDYFPGLRERIELAAEKSKTVDEMAARFKEALKQATAEKDAKVSEIQKMAKATKERRITQTGLRHFAEEQKDPAKVIDAFMKSNSRMNDAKIIGEMVKADKQFKEDLKGAFKDHINRLDSDAQRLAYIQDADNQKLITDLFGKEMTARLNDVAESILREGLVKPSDIKAEMMDVKHGWLRGSLGTLAAYLKFGFSGAATKVLAERAADKYMRLPEKMAQVRVKAALEPKEAARLLAKTQVPKTALTANIPKAGGALIPRMGKEQDNSEDTVDERIRRVLEGRK